MHQDHNNLIRSIKILEHPLEPATINNEREGKCVFINDNEISYNFQISYAKPVSEQNIVTLGINSC